MMLLSYNRKLAWLVVGTTVWALFSLAASLGQTRLGPPPLSIQVGSPPGEIRLQGKLASVTETDGQLEIVIAVGPGATLELPGDLPHDLSITLEDADQPHHGPPDISLDGHPVRIRRGIDSQWIDTEHYMIRFGRDEVRINQKGRRPQSRQHENLRRQGPWPEQEPEAARPQQRRK